MTKKREQKTIPIIPEIRRPSGRKKLLVTLKKPKPDIRETAIAPSSDENKPEVAQEHISTIQLQEKPKEMVKLSLADFKAKRKRPEETTEVLQSPTKKAETTKNNESTGPSPTKKAESSISKTESVIEMLNNITTHHSQLQPSKKEEKKQEDPFALANESKKEQERELLKK